MVFIRTLPVKSRHFEQEIHPDGAKVQSFLFLIGVLVRKKTWGMSYFN